MGMKCLAQGHNTAPRVRINPPPCDQESDALLTELLVVPRFSKYMDCTVYEAKTKALICSFVFAYAKSWFSHEVAQLILTIVSVLLR